MSPSEYPELIGLAALVLAGIVAWVTVSRRRRSADAANAYLKGFRYILSDEPDAALHELTRAASIDERSLETYFALGALFRRTGEHERAIRLHQNMLLRPELEPRARDQARLELALDYQRAGMLERAAESFEQILNDDPANADALTRLRQIHEEGKDFAHAAEVEGRHVALGGGSRQVLAHLLAEAALAESDPELARAFASRAVEVEPQSAHAVLTRGLLRLRGGDASGAADLKQACALDAELAVRAAEPLFEAAGTAAGAFFLELAGAKDHAALRVALARCLKREGRAEEAIAALRRALELDPRFVEARVELGRALLESSMSAEVRREFEALLAALGQPSAGFHCSACGHGFVEAVFRCPRCHAWDTVHRGAPDSDAAARRVA